PRSAASSASRTTCARSRRAWNAAFRSTASTTTRSATASRSSSRKSAPAAWKARSKVEFARRDRLVELFREEVAQILRKVKDPRLSGFLTVTDVELSQDQKTVFVFYSIMGTEENRRSSAEALKSAEPFVHHELRSRVHMKVVPAVKFEYDRTPERA